MNLKFMLGAIMGLVFVFIFSGAALGVTADLIGKVTAATATGGPLETFASGISTLLTSILDAAGIGGALLPLAIIAKIFGVDKIFE